MSELEPESEPNDRDHVAALGEPQETPEPPTPDLSAFPYSHRRALCWAGVVVAAVVALLVAVLVTGASSSRTTIQVTIPFKFCSPLPPCQQPWADETLEVRDGGSTVFSQRVGTLQRHANGYQIDVSLEQGHAYQAELFFSLAGKPYHSETVTITPKNGRAELAFADGAAAVTAKS